MTEFESTAPVTPSPPDITRSAILAGICALSPVPFIDDLIIGAIRRHAARRVFRAHGMELSWGQQRALTRTGRNLLVGCLLGVVVYPIRKIFRKLFYIFAVKEAVDVASRLLHQGRLWQHALDQGCFEGAELGSRKEPLDKLALVVRQTCEEGDTSPISQIFRGTFAGGGVFLRRLGLQVVRTLRALGVMRREEAVDALPDRIGGERERGLVDELSAALKGEGDYFEALGQRFDIHWAAAAVGEIAEREVPVEAELEHSEEAAPEHGEE